MSKDKIIRDALARTPFWDNTAPAFLDFCLAYGRIRHYTPKQYLFFAGDDPANVYLLLEGRVQLILMNEFTEKIFRVLRPPLIFPEIVLDARTYPYSALALENTDVLTLERQTLVNFLEDNPSLLWNFVRALALDQRRALRQIKNLSLGDARLRLGAKLFALAHAHGQTEQGKIVITIPLSATELAAMCGLARESVSRILGELKASGIIGMEKRKLWIQNLDRLRQWIRERSEQQGF